MITQNRVDLTLGLVEDHVVLRKGLRALLEEEPGIQVLFDVGDGKQLMEALAQTSVQIVLLDVEMPVMNGIDALTNLALNFPKVKVIMLSSYNEPEIICKSIDVGAHGYLLKTSDFETVIEAIERVGEGGYFFDSIQSIIKETGNISTFSFKSGIVSLSKREMQVARLICMGLSNAKISEKLFISIRTVENHRRAIFKKTNTKNSAGLTLYALKNGYLRN